MALSERLAYILDFNTTGAVRDIQTLGNEADKSLGKVDGRLDKAAGNLTKFGAGAVAFAGIAGAGLYNLAQGAAEAEANSAALEQVVGELAAHEVEEWAEDSAEAVGLASKEAIAATTSFAGLGKIIGKDGEELAEFSTGLVEMAADMAAFKDVTPQQALEDLQSGFAGSTEVLRKYNIFLDDATLKQAYFRETGERVTGTLTSQQRIIATHSEIVRQGGDMWGQWGRESGELMGQQAQLSANLTNLKDNIGQGVLPMVTSMVSGLNSAVSAFSELDPTVQATIGKFAALGTAGIALIGTLSMVAGQVIKMRDRFKNADGTLNAFGKTAKGVGVGLGVASAALAAYSIHQERSNHHAAVAIEKFEEIGRAATENMGQLFVDAMLSAFLAGQSTDDFVRSFARSNIEAARRLVEHAEATGWASEQIEALGEAIEAEEEARAQSAETLEEYGDVTEDVADETSNMTDKARHAADVMKNEVNRTLAEQEEQLEATESALESFTEATERWGEKTSAAFSTGQGEIQSFTDGAKGDLETFRNELRLNTQMATDWKDDLAVIGNATSEDFAAFLADMGLSGLGLVDELAGVLADGGSIDDIYAEWLANSEAATRDVRSEIDPIPGQFADVIESIPGKTDKAWRWAAIEGKKQADAAGADIGQGVADGMESKIPTVRTTAQTLVNEAIAAAQATAGIESPSKVFKEEVGEPISEGIAEGIEEAGDDIGDALEDAIEDATDKAIDAAEALVDEMGDTLGGVWDSIGEGFKLEDLEAALDEALEREGVAAATDKLVDARRGTYGADRARIDARDAHDALVAERDMAVRARDRIEGSFGRNSAEWAEANAEVERLDEEIANAAQVYAEAAAAWEAANAEVVEAEEALAEAIENADSDVEEAALRLLEERMDADPAYAVANSDEIRRLGALGGLSPQQINALIQASLGYGDATISAQTTIGTAEGNAALATAIVDGFRDVFGPGGDLEGITNQTIVQIESLGIPFNEEQRQQIWDIVADILRDQEAEA